MNDDRPYQSRLEDLLSQDADVSSFQFDEFRANLEESIMNLEQRARIIRRATLWALAIFIICVVLLPLAGLSGISNYEWVRWVICGSCLVAMFTTGVLAGIYQYKYAPILARTKADLTSTMIAQLQQQVADLSRKLDSQ